MHEKQATLDEVLTHSKHERYANLSTHLEVLTLVPISTGSHIPTQKIQSEATIIQLDSIQICTKIKTTTKVKRQKSDPYLTLRRSVKYTADDTKLYCKKCLK